MIRHIIYIFLLLFFSCSEEDEANINPINFGADNSLDIITWNIENFPKSTSTVDYVADLIQAFNGIDIIALQEIIYKTKPEVIIECGICSNFQRIEFRLTSIVNEHLGDFSIYIVRRIWAYIQILW